MSREPCKCGCGAFPISPESDWCRGHSTRTLSPVRYVVDSATGCWVWQRSKTPAGYGQISRNGKLALAHRVYYEDYKGPIPEGLHLDHLCRNRACVNPDHLEPVTRGENLRRGEGFAGVNARKTHCVNGHPLAGDNLYMTPRGRRNCKTCRRESSQRLRDSENPEETAARLAYMKEWRARRRMAGGGQSEAAAGSGSNWSASGGRTTEAPH